MWTSRLYNKRQQRETRIVSDAMPGPNNNKNPPQKPRTSTVSLMEAEISPKKIVITHSNTQKRNIYAWIFEGKQPAWGDATQTAARHTSLMKCAQAARARITGDPAQRPVLFHESHGAWKWRQKTAACAYLGASSGARLLGGCGTPPHRGRPERPLIWTDRSVLGRHQRFFVRMFEGLSWLRSIHPHFFTAQGLNQPTATPARDLTQTRPCSPWCWHLSALYQTIF